jgi:hypothetical protein
MAEVRMSKQRSVEPPKDLAILVQTLRDALTVIDDCDPDRNPARCMRQIRRLLDNTDVRIAVTRVAADIPINSD